MMKCNPENKVGGVEFRNKLKQMYILTWSVFVQNYSGPMIFPSPSPLNLEKRYKIYLLNKHVFLLFTCGHPKLRSWWKILINFELTCLECNC